MTRVPALIVGLTPKSPLADGVVATLAARLSDRARRAGLRVCRIELSRIRCSRSRYLHVEDGAGRRWTVRISDHYRPDRTGHLLPHFDFVSKDGVSGLDAAAEYLTRIARGEIAWVPPTRSPRRKGVR